MKCDPPPPLLLQPGEIFTGSFGKSVALTTVLLCLVALADTVGGLGEI